MVLVWCTQSSLGELVVAYLDQGLKRCREVLGLGCGFSAEGSGFTI